MDADRRQIAASGGSKPISRRNCPSCRANSTWSTRESNLLDTMTQFVNESDTRTCQCERAQGAYRCHRGFGSAASRAARRRHLRARHCPRHRRQQQLPRRRALFANGAQPRRPRTGIWELAYQRVQAVRRRSAPSKRSTAEPPHSNRPSRRSAVRRSSSSRRYRRTVMHWRPRPTAPMARPSRQCGISWIRWHGCSSRLRRF